VKEDMKRAKIAAFLPLIFALSGCNLVVMSPSGDIAEQQANLIIYSTVLMLIVIVPVIVLTIFFAIKYRASTKMRPMSRIGTTRPRWKSSSGRCRLQSSSVWPV
jgi:cytochrome o ubiquinol oxidase subunit 2